MNKIPIKQLVIVEGKYDKITLENILDAQIIACNGFGVFKDEALRETLRTMARERGAIILTDSDRAGNVIRSHLQTILQGAEVYLLYTPALQGKERRKNQPSKEGFLGVEGMNSAVLYKLFDEFRAVSIPRNIKTADLYVAGLTGAEGSVKKKEALLRNLGLPVHLSNNALLKELNRRYTKEEFEDVVQKIKA